MTPTSTAPLPDSRSRPWIPATWHSWLFFSDRRASSTTAVTVTCPWGWTSTTWPRCSSAREMTTLLLLRPMMVVILSLSCSKALVRTVDFACFWCFFVFFFFGDSVWLLRNCGCVLGKWRWGLECCVYGFGFLLSLCLVAVKMWEFVKFLVGEGGILKLSRKKKKNKKKIFELKTEKKKKL